MPVLQIDYKFRTIAEAQVQQPTTRPEIYQQKRKTLKYPFLTLVTWRNHVTWPSKRFSHFIPSVYVDFSCTFSHLQFQSVQFSFGAGKIDLVQLYASITQDCSARLYVKPVLTVLFFVQYQCLAL